jgi:NAD(P)-dependent dehydrogenase (short-subunit alcohol dehydrogenase family)
VGLNLGGYFVTSQIFSKYFQNQGYGNIVNISSIYGVISPKFEIYKGTSMTTSVEYAAFKSGLIHLTKYMAKYFKGMGIRVNAISPGGILDAQHELFLKAYNAQCSSVGMLDKGDINGSLLYLLSDLSKYVNGQNIVVDDGFSL